MENAIELIMSNPLYMVGAGVLALVILIFLLKKIFKIMIIIIVIALAYGAFLYLTEENPMKLIKKKLDSGKTTINKLDDATKDMRKEALDKVIDDVDKRLKEAGKKKH